MKRKIDDLHIQEQLAQRIVRRTAIRGTLLTALGAILWAASSACGQYLMQKDKDPFPPEWLASTRILLAGFLLTAIGMTQNRSGVKELFKNAKDVVRLVLYGVFGFMLAQYSFLQAIDISNAATATVLQYTAPVIIVAVVCIRMRRAPTVIEAISIVLAVTGVFFLSTHGDLSSLSVKGGSSIWMVLMWGMLSATGMVFFSILPAKIIPKYGSILVTGLGMLSGGIVMLFIARPWEQMHLIRFDFLSVLAYIGLAVVGTTIGYTLYIQGISDIGSARASMIASIEPVTSAVFAALLGTAFGIFDLVGMACVIVTVFLLSITPKKVNISFHPAHSKKKRTEQTRKDAADK